MSRTHFLTLLSAVLLALATTYLLKSTRLLGENVAGYSAAMEVLADQKSPRTIQPGADITLVVFTDYQCPACRKAHPAMHAAVGNDRRVQVVYKDWPIFGERSERAARVALASARQGIYPALHDRLMRSPAFHEAALRDAVEMAGGNWDRLQSDLVEHRASIDAQLADNRSDAMVLGLQGTPGYLIGSTLIRGALTEREFVRALKQARSES